MLLSRVKVKGSCKKCQFQSSTWQLSGICTVEYCRSDRPWPQKWRMPPKTAPRGSCMYSSDMWKDGDESACGAHGGIAAVNGPLTRHVQWIFGRWKSRGRRPFRRHPSFLSPLCDCCGAWNSQSHPVESTRTRLINSTKLDRSLGFYASRKTQWTPIRE